MIWPLETVTLIDVNGETVDSWVGYLVPPYVGSFPNTNASVAFTVVYECGMRWILPPGDLDQEIWDALMVHESWCKSESLARVMISAI